MPLPIYMLRQETGVELACARLCDYGHFFGTRDFKKPAFDLFTHEEFCRLGHDEFVAGGFDAPKLADLLCPVPRFCNGQRENYYIIDTVGDVYSCDGVIGERDRVVFNLLEEPESADDGHLSQNSHDPHENAGCRACYLLPICQGNCNWERRATGMQCHPLKTMMPDYLRDYRSCFTEAPNSAAPFCRFA